MTRNLELQIFPKRYFLFRLITVTVMTKPGDYAECLLQTLRSLQGPSPHQTSASSPDANLEVRGLKYVCFCKITISIHLVGE